MIKLRFLKNLIILATLSATFTSNAKADQYEVRELCEKNHGVWREFGNDCANNCYSTIQKTLPFCVNAITFDCDCSPDRCWDDGECTLIKSYQQKIDQLKTLEEEKLNEDKNAKEKEKSNNKVTPVAEITSNQQIQTQKLDKYLNSFINPSIVNQDLKGQVALDQDLTSINKNSSENEQAKICNLQGGTIKDFSNGCANNCSAVARPENNNINNNICTTMITKACDCGSGKCWDEKNNQCIEIDKYIK